MLFPLMWQAIGLCENYANLKVIAAVSDKASNNQKLFRMHYISNKTVTIYKTQNVFSEDEDRHLFLISDPPHLVKMVRNNLASSGCQKKINVE